MFNPPRCPARSCRYFKQPEPGFYRLRGRYSPKCRAHSVQRYECKGCGKTFSRQTFRVDYRDHRPDLNAKLYRCLASGLGLRQSGRLLKISRPSLDYKFRKIARHLRWLHRNWMRTASIAEPTFLLDEMITFETDRRVRPLTLPVVIQKRSMFVVAADCAPIRTFSKKTKSVEKAIAAYERRYGKRPTLSSPCVRRALAQAKPLCRGATQVRLICDEKRTYPGIARQVFGRRRVQIEQHSGKAKRTTKNPLFRINLTNAMARDLNGRLRRRSWLVSKKRAYLRLQLALFVTFRNYIRPRFNRDEKTPAQLLGLCRRAMSFEGLLSWRQDWWERSIDPRLRLT